MTKPKAPKPAAKPRKRAGRQANSDLRLRKFFERYMVNGEDGTEAAIFAGYSAKTATQAGSRALSHVKVQGWIEKRHQELLDDMKITTDRILKERARCAFFNPKRLLDHNGNMIPIHKLDDDTAAAIAGMDFDGGRVVKLKLADKNAALTSLERQRGLYKADNEQLKPDAVDPSRLDRIEAARAIAFVLAKAYRIKKGK